MAFPYKRAFVSLVLGAALLTGGVAIAYRLVTTKPQAARSTASTPPPVVEVMQLERQTIQQRITGFGSARSDRAVTLTAEVVGEIVELAPGLKDGAHVAAGDVLLRIDDRDYRLQLARAESLATDAAARLEQLAVERDNLRALLEIADRDVEIQRDEMQRLADLLETNSAGRTEFNRAQLAYQAARRTQQELQNQIALIDPRRRALQASRDARLAEADLARRNIERCGIIAPFTGQVDEVFVEVGDVVQIGGALLRLLDTQHIEVPLSLPASAYARVAVGAPCKLAVESMPKRVWTGRISRRSPRADEGSRTFMAYVEVDNAEQTTPLVSGFFVRAEVQGPTLRNVLAVPRGAIVDGAVYVANADVAHRRPVQVQRYVEDRAVIAGPLEEGDQVIVTNLDVLADGAAIMVAGNADADTRLVKQRPAITEASTP